MRVSLLLFAGLILGCSKGERPPELYEWANGLEPNQADMLGSGRISSGAFEMNAAITSDGSEIFFSRSSSNGLGDGSVILHASWRDSQWTKPDTLPFSGQSVDADPYISKDNRRLFFASKRREDGGLKGDFDLWYCDRDGNGWGTPVRLPEPVNSRDHDVSPWLTDDGTLWFSSRRVGGEGDYDIWYAKAEGDSFAAPVNAGPDVNTLGVEVDVCLTGDGRLLFFASHDQVVHFGSGDIYMMLRDEDGYVGPYNLGQPVNSEAMECCPSITHDGQLLLFSSTRSIGRTIAPAETPGVPEGQPQPPSTPGNGLGDIYMVELQNLMVVQEMGWSGQK